MTKEEICEEVAKIHAAVKKIGAFVDSKASFDHEIKYFDEAKGAITLIRARAVDLTFYAQKITEIEDRCPICGEATKSDTPLKHQCKFTDGDIAYAIARANDLFQMTRERSEIKPTDERIPGLPLVSYRDLFILAHYASDQFNKEPT